MIPVKPQPEPAEFDETVRQPGLAWIRGAQLDPANPFPEGMDARPYWRECLRTLYEAYDGVCAYLGIFFERVTGAASDDHFVPKSTAKAEFAYHWPNYRLACLRMNTLKRDFADVLDPFEIREGMFHLELVTGRIYPNPDLLKGEFEQVERTIVRLGLDEPDCRGMRSRDFGEYVSGNVSADFLRRRFPFLWSEASRQGLL